MNPRTILAIGFLSAATASFAAGHGELSPGRYVSDDGELTLDRASDGRTTFELTVVSSWNGHTCGPLQGEIHDGRARVTEASDDDGTAQGCAVAFAADGDGIVVTSQGDACSEQCGDGVGFDGRYLKVQPACETAALAQTRRQFKIAYDTKDYTRALGILQPALARCAAVLDAAGADALRNDVAITQYHAHDFAGCRRTLEPLRDAAAKSDADLKSEYPEFALETRLPGIRAARTNLKLCADAPAGAPAR